MCTINFTNCVVIIQRSHKFINFELTYTTKTPQPWCCPYDKLFLLCWCIRTVLLSENVLSIYEHPCADICCLQKRSNAKFLHLQVQKWKLCYMFEIVHGVLLKIILTFLFPYWNLSHTPKFKSINHHSFLKWSESGLKNIQK